MSVTSYSERGFMNMESPGYEVTGKCIHDVLSVMKFSPAVGLFLFVNDSAL